LDPFPLKIIKIYNYISLYPISRLNIMKSTLLIPAVLVIALFTGKVTAFW